MSVMKDVLSTPDSEYKVLISLMKFMTIIYDFLRLIRSFPQVAFEGTSRLIELIKVTDQYFNSSIIDLQYTDLFPDPRWRSLPLEESRCDYQ